MNLFVKVSRVCASHINVRRLWRLPIEISRGPSTWRPPVNCPWPPQPSSITFGKGFSVDFDPCSMEKPGLLPPKVILALPSPPLQKALALPDFGLGVPAPSMSVAYEDFQLKFLKDHHHDGLPSTARDLHNQVLSHLVTDSRWILIPSRWRNLASFHLAHRCKPLWPCLIRV